MLKILVKKQLGDIFRSYTYDAKKNRARSKEATLTEAHRLQTHQSIPERGFAEAGRAVPAGAVYE